ncbi:hypothetical protein GCM10022215_32460 [Nocardioides fonticola]|uniref:Uncharacterized protein n=1 Tax=Nocardioides fonticola TaxID=450363 RepID=A0ABP7XRN9_9ACTN
MTDYTAEELVDTMIARFGRDEDTWSFTCPSCGDRATLVDFRRALAEHPRTRSGTPVAAEDIHGQECIGRTLGALNRTDESQARLRNQGKARGCTWAAYGLIPGPNFLIRPDGRRVPMFAPSTVLAPVETVVPTGGVL